jgi:hypothetical protein
MTHPTITLRPDDLAAVYEHGRERDAARDHSRNYNIEREQTHIRGLKGELAAARYYGLDPDLQCRPRGDDGTDFVAEYDGERATIDVKTTAYTRDPWLRVRADGHHTADYYLLAAVDGPAVTLAGWASASTVAATPISAETGHHDNHILRGDDLATPPAPDALQRQRAVADGSGLTAEDIEQIKADPVLELSDFDVDADAAAAAEETDTTADDDALAFECAACGDGTDEDLRWHSEQLCRECYERETAPEGAV